jgi:drug/metabolite transporter (DMT)-like permease
MTQPRVPWQVKYVAIVLIWGSSFLLMKVGLESLAAVQISALRILSGALVITTLLYLRGGRLPTEPRVWGHLLVSGFLLTTLPFTLFALAETRVSSALAGIGNATSPIVAVVAVLAMLPGERATGRRLVAVLLGFLGVVTIMQPWTAVGRPDLVGFGMALLGGACYGVGWTYNRRFLAAADLGGIAQPAATLVAGMVLMVPVLGLWALAQPAGLPSAWGYDGAAAVITPWLPLLATLALGVVGTGIAYTLQFDVVRGAGPIVALTITYLIPVVAVLLGVLVLGEHLGPAQYAGFAVVLGAAWVVGRPQHRSGSGAGQRMRRQARSPRMASTAEASPSTPSQRISGTIVVDGTRE